MQPQLDLATQAISLVKEFGSVHAGSPSGDFSVIELDLEDGWVVTSHHPDVLTYVSPGDIDGEPQELAVGFLGRSKRDQDATELQILHIENRGV